MLRRSRPRSHRQLFPLRANTEATQLRKHCLIRRQEPGKDPNSPLRWDVLCRNQRRRRWGRGSRGAEEQNLSDGLKDKEGDINVKEKLTCSALSTPSVFAASCWPSSSRASPTCSSCARRWAACAKWWRATCSGSQVGCPPQHQVSPSDTCQPA